MLNRIHFPIYIFCLVMLSAFSSASAETDLMKTYPLYAHSGHDHDMDMHSGHTKGPVVDINVQPSPIKTGTAETITLSFTDAQGNPIRELTTTHERILHVVIASQDFSQFAHIHPEDFGPITTDMKEKGRYSVRYTFQKSGRYIVAVDFADKNDAYSRHFIEEVEGTPKMAAAAAADFSRKKKFADLDVTLRTESESIVAGKETKLIYRFEKNGRPVTDLQPYLAAPMHASVISTDLKQFIHEHGLLPGMSDMGMHGHHHMMHEMTVPSAFGPEIALPVTFPEKGTYVIFGEVQHQGKIVPTKFMVEVK